MSWTNPVTHFEKSTLPLVLCPNFGTPSEAIFCKRTKPTHGENDIVASTRRFVNIASANQIVGVTIAIVTT